MERAPFLSSSLVPLTRQMLSGGFIWDDGSYIVKSPHILAPDGLYRIWFTTEPEEYYPISNSGFWLQWRLFGAIRLAITA